MAASEARLVVVQEVVLCKKHRELVEHKMLKCLCNEWEKEYRSVVFLKVLDLERVFLISGVTQPHLNAVGNVPV